jgi:hypothetical protein
MDALTTRSAAARATDGRLVLSIMRAAPQFGMNIFELMWFILIVSGAVLGGISGYEHFGVWGAVLGVLAGGCLGFLVVAAVVFLFAFIFKMLFGGAIFPPRLGKTDASDENTLDA